MKKSLSLILALAVAAGCLCILTSAGADLETWYVKTGDGGNLNVRSLENGETIGGLPYGSKVGVEWFRDEWAIILWGSYGNAKVMSKYLVSYDPGKYVGPSDDKGNVLSDSALGSETVNGLNKQYSMLTYVTPYTVRVVPDTRTGTARFRWAPSKYSTLIAQLPANYELSVIAASSNWLMVQDPGSGKIGYIATKFTKVP